jgi:hypothetical protein
LTLGGSTYCGELLKIRPKGLGLITLKRKISYYLAAKFKKYVVKILYKSFVTYNWKTRGNLVGKANATQN